MKNAARQKVKCDFCKNLLLEKNLFAHSCLKKLRFNDNSRQAEMAYLTFSKYLKYAYFNRRTPTPKEFVGSSEYAYFYDFAGYLLREEPWDVEPFMRYLARARVPIKRWKSSAVYDGFLAARVLEETPDEAVARSMKTMGAWASRTGHPWTEYFRQVATPRAVEELLVGDISVWLLLTTDSGLGLLKRMSAEQLNIIESAIDFDVWFKKMDDRPVDADVIKRAFAEAGL